MALAFEQLTQEELAEVLAGARIRGEYREFLKEVDAATDEEGNPIRSARVNSNGKSAGTVYSGLNSAIKAEKLEDTWRVVRQGEKITLVRK